MPSRVIRCEFEEEDAFWTWAVVEVPRLTGIRQEELLGLCTQKQGITTGRGRSKGSRKRYSTSVRRRCKSKRSNSYLLFG
jgi:hypothetical protein